FIKGLFKIALVGSVAISLLVPAIADVHRLIGLEAMQILGTMKSMVMHLLIGVMIVIFAITVFDVFYQRFQHIRSLRMSRQELKEEFRDTEDDPIVKGRFRKFVLGPPRAR